MRRLIVRIVPVAAVALGAVPAHAAPPGSYDDPGYVAPDRVTKPGVVRLPAVVVAPSRSRRKAFEADRTVRTVGRKQLARTHAQSAPEALHDAAGVMVQKTNRGSGAPFLRGLVGPRNLLVVDGLRFSNSTFRTGPNQYLALLDPASMRRFEVLMGPASVVYGSDAMGGVVAASPWRVPPAAGFRGRAGLQAASADSSGSLWTTLGYRSGGVAVQGGAALRRFGTLTAGDGYVLPISDYQTAAWHLRARYDLGKSTWIGATWLGARIRDAGRTDRLNHGRFRFYDNDSDMGWIELRHRGTGTLRSLRVALSFHRTHEAVERFRCSVSDPLAERQACIDDALPSRADNAVVPTGNVQRQEQWQDTVVTPGLLVLSKLHLTDGIDATVGLEAHHDTVSASFRDRRSDKSWAWKDAARGHFSEGSTYLSGGVFALLRSELVKASAGRLVAELGARYAVFQAHADDVPQFATVDYRQAGVVGSVGLKWLTSSWMAYVNASQGLRAPNLQESTVLGDTGSKIEVPNGHLLAESSLAIEAGARLRTDAVRVALVGFANMISDTIDERELDKAQWQKLGIADADVGTKPVVQRVNSGAGRFVGAELQADVELPMGGLIWARGGFIRGEIDRKDETVTARRNPPPMGSAGLRWRIPGLKGVSAGVYSRFAAGADDLHPSDEKDLRICEDPAAPGKTYKDSGKRCSGTPGWATANLRLSWRLDENLRVDASGLNLLDRRYRYHGSGIDEPGRGFALSVEGRL